MTFFSPTLSHSPIPSTHNMVTLHWCLTNNITTNIGNTMLSTRRPGEWEKALDYNYTRYHHHQKGIKHVKVWLFYDNMIPPKTRKERETTFDDKTGSNYALLLLSTSSTQLSQWKSFFFGQRIKKQRETRRISVPCSSCVPFLKLFL